MPPSSRQSTEYCAPPTSSFERSLDKSRWRSASASGPEVSTSPMCETSKTPQAERTARCSTLTPSYCTGICQPANGTSLAPAAT